MQGDNLLGGHGIDPPCPQETCNNITTPSLQLPVSLPHRDSWRQPARVRPVGWTGGEVARGWEGAVKEADARSLLAGGDVTGARPCHGPQ